MQASRRPAKFHTMPLILGLGIFLWNIGPTLIAYLSPPPGSVGTLLPQHMDFLQYQTWINAYRTSNGWLLPDYHAPWATEPALLNPACWLIGRTSALLRIDGLTIYRFLYFAASIGGGYALWFALLAFTDSRRQARLALLLSFCGVPVASVLALATHLFGTSNPLLSLISLADKVHSRFSNDSFLNGVSGGLLVLFGTVATVLCMGLLARYVSTDSRPYLRWAGVVIGVSAFVHPFEVFVMAAGGVLALLLRRNRPWLQSVRDTCWLSLPALAGLAPYVFLTFRHPWLKQAAEQNRWQALSPPMLVLMLGVPTVFGLLSFLLPLGKRSPTDVLLNCWFFAVLFGVYVPWLPWSHHLLDGFYCAAALLMVRHAVRWNALRGPVRRLAFASLAALVAVSLVVRIVSWTGAVAAARVPGNDSSAVVSRANLDLLRWLQGRAQSGDLILAPKAAAGLFATLPMHSFASHWLFSLSWNEQTRLSDNFYQGALDAASAAAFLDDFGVRFVVLPDASPAARYFSGQMPIVRLDSEAIYERPNARLRPFTGK